MRADAGSIFRKSEGRRQVNHSGRELDLGYHEVVFNATINAPSVTNNHESNDIRKEDSGRNEHVCVNNAYIYEIVNERNQVQ